MASKGAVLLSRIIRSIRASSPALSSADPTCCPQSVTSPPACRRAIFLCRRYSRRDVVQRFPRLEKEEPESYSPQSCFYFRPAFSLLA